MDGGYRVHRMLNPESTRLHPAYRIFKAEPRTNELLLKLSGDYTVEDSWSNSLFKISKLTLKYDKNDNTLRLILYPKDATNPSNILEMTNCSYLEPTLSGYKMTNSGVGVWCNNNDDGDWSGFELIETNKDTRMTVQQEEFFTRILTGGKEVQIKSPYAIRVRIYSDAGKPVLALKKVS